MLTPPTHLKPKEHCLHHSEQFLRARMIRSDPGKQVLIPIRIYSYYNSPAQKIKYDRLAPEVPLFLSHSLPCQSQTAEDKYANPLPHREEAQPVDLWVMERYVRKCCASWISQASEISKYLTFPDFLQTSSNQVIRYVGLECSVPPVYVFWPSPWDLSSAKWQWIVDLTMVLETTITYLPFLQGHSREYITPKTVVPTSMQVTTCRRIRSPNSPLLFTQHEPCSLRMMICRILELLLTRRQWSQSLRYILTHESKSSYFNHQVRKVSQVPQSISIE